MGPLKNQSALVIGGSSGVGLATAKAFLAAGAIVSVVGRSERKLHAAREALPGLAGAYQGDGADRGAIRAIFDRIGSVDHVAITLGGGGALGPFQQIDEQQLRAAFDRKFWSVFAAIQSCAPFVKRSLTYATGASALRPSRERLGLAATNGALNAIVGVLALELAPVRVNVVAPGLIDTPYWDAMDTGRKEAMFRDTAARLPVGRVGTAEDVATSFLYAASNGFMTGSVIECDGGLRIS